MRDVAEINTSTRCVKLRRNREINTLNRTLKCSYRDEKSPLVGSEFQTLITRPTNLAVPDVLMKYIETFLATKAVQCQQNFDQSWSG